MTILDVDTNDGALADALDHHGHTPDHRPLWLGQPSGLVSLERRKAPIRPESEKPIDILGSGFVVAPPSRGIKIELPVHQGDLDDLDQLPVLRGIAIATPPLSLSVQAR